MQTNLKDHIIRMVVAVTAIFSFFSCWHMSTSKEAKSISGAQASRANSIKRMLCQSGYWVVYIVCDEPKHGYLLYHPLNNIYRFYSNGTFAVDLYFSHGRKFGGDIDRNFHIGKWRYIDSMQVLETSESNKITAFHRDTLVVDNAPYQDLWICVGSNVNTIHNEIKVKYTDTLRYKGPYCFKQLDDIYPFGNQKVRQRIKEREMLVYINAPATCYIPPE